MKYIIWLLAFVVPAGVFGQATGGVFKYNRTTQGTQPFSVVGDRPLDAKSKYYDTVSLKWREFVSTAEVLSYFPVNSGFRTKQQTVIVNTGGTLSNGRITGGVNAEYWFKDTTSNAGLVLKIPPVYWLGSGNNIYSGNTGNVGIGLTNPGSKLSVRGNMNVIAPGVGNKYGALTVDSNRTFLGQISTTLGDVSSRVETGQNYAGVYTTNEAQSGGIQLTFSKAAGAKFYQDQTNGFGAVHGFEYAGNYRSTFTEFSFADKGYVDAAIAAAIAGLGGGGVPTLNQVLTAGNTSAVNITAGVATFSALNVPGLTTFGGGTTTISSGGQFTNSNFVNTPMLQLKNGGGFITSLLNPANAPANRSVYFPYKVGTDSVAYLSDVRGIAGGGTSFTVDSTTTAVPIRLRNGVLSADVNWNAAISGYGTIVKTDSTVATVGYSRVSVSQVNDSTFAINQGDSTYPITLVGSGSGGSGGSYTPNINRTPTINGFVLTFPGSYTATRFALYHNGLRLVRGVHYTETTPASGVVTLLFTPAYPETIVADY